jgi:acyl-CoA dehydrogenase
MNRAPDAGRSNAPDSPIYLEEHDMLRAQIRRFVEQEIAPHGDAWEEAGMTPRETLRRMGELGFLGIRYPAQYGGSEMDARGSLVLAEELGRGGYGGATITVLVHTDMASPHLANAGTPEQIARWMPDIVAGKKICAVAVTEPGAGSDVAGIRTTARRDGDHYVLNGTKMFITNGVHADIYFVAAKTNPGVKGHHGTSIFIVEKGTPGFSVGRALKKTGWLSSDTAELILDDARVPAWNLLGAENRGFYAVMKNFQNERLVLCGQAIGESEAAIELTLRHVTQRHAFGEPLWRKQAIRQKLAMLAAKVEAGKRLAEHCAWLDAQGRDCVKQVSMAKAFCCEVVNEVMYACVQFHGGMGYMRESAIERMSRDARVEAIGGGATEVMLEEVAKRMGA